MTTDHLLDSGVNVSGPALDDLYRHALYDNFSIKLLNFVGFLITRIPDHTDSSVDFKYTESCMSGCLCRVVGLICLGPLGMTKSTHGRTRPCGCALQQRQGSSFA